MTPRGGSRLPEETALEQMRIDPIGNPPILWHEKGRGTWETRES